MLLRNLATGKASGTFLTFLSDTEGWFSQRGVERITYITPRGDDDGQDDNGPDIPIEGGDDGGQGLKPEWSRDGKPADHSSADTPSSMPSGLELETKATLQFDLPGKLNWLLAPYAHRPSDKMLDVFKAAVKAMFTGWNDPAFLSTLIGNKAHRDTLRDCYDLIWADHNLVSMALYAGPWHSSNRHTESWHSYRNDRYWFGSDPGHAIAWLGTGDMHLNVGRRRKAFLAHYAKLIDKVNVFGLPHHGSDRNFDLSLLSALHQANQYVAAAGANSYGHPGQMVRRAVRSHGKKFIHVSSSIHSALEWKHFMR